MTVANHILYFTADVSPSQFELDDAAKIGRVAFRVGYIAARDAPEPCTAVAGRIPPNYKDVPVAKAVKGKSAAESKAEAEAKAEELRSKAEERAKQEAEEAEKKAAAEAAAAEAAKAELEGVGKPPGTYDKKATQKAEAKKDWK